MIKSGLVKILIATTFVMLALTACGNKQDDAKKSDEIKEEQDGIKDTDGDIAESGEIQTDTSIEMDIQEFAKKIVERRTDISFAEMTEGYISGVMDFDVSKTAEYKVYVDATGSTIDEFGIFKANGGSEKEVEEMLKSYLNTRLDTWMDEYMPEEKPKLEKAEIKANGQYYIYAILGDGEKEQVFSDFDSVLLK